MKIKVAVIGASGYAGLELVRLLLEHPEAELVLAAALDSADRPLAELHPELRGRCDLFCYRYSRDLIQRAGADVAFAATPNEASAEIIPALLGAGIRAIDLSGAFRLKAAAAYPRWYGFEHPAPELLARAVYGLSEANRQKIAGAQLVANPGCYPTSILLPLLPLLEADLIDLSSPLICDAKSGVTGAGRSPRSDLMFAEVNENFKAYSVLSHRHAPEIAEQAGLKNEDLVFVPHLLPINRGILSTIYLRLSAKSSDEQIGLIYQESYAGEPFVRLLGPRRFPEIRNVARTNFCDIGWALSGDGRSLVVISALDNLVKGAAGQAIQNMNLMFGLEETLGLSPARRAHGRLQRAGGRGEAGG